MTTATPVTMPSADFGTRFSAFMIDGLVLFSAQWIVFIVLSRQLQAAGLTSTDVCNENTVELCEGPSTLLWAILLLFLLASTVGYHAIFEGRYGATPGKRWMGLAVVDERGRSPIGLAAGLLRSVVRQSFWISLFFVLDASPLVLGLPSILFVALPMVTLGVFVMGALRADGLAGHDMVARTAVVRADQVRSAPATAEPIVPESGLDAAPERTAATDLETDRATDRETAPTESSEESV